MKKRVDSSHETPEPHVLPTIGHITLLRTLADTPDVDYSNFCRALAASPLVENQIIRVARSAGNGRLYEINDLHHAVALIGLNRVREVLIRVQREMELQARHTKATA